MQLHEAANSAVSLNKFLKTFAPLDIVAYSLLEAYISRTTTNEMMYDLAESKFVLSGTP